MAVSVSSFSLSGGGGGVTTITGTANQIVASAPNGPVTLSLSPVLIAPGTFQSIGLATFSGGLVSVAGANTIGNVSIGNINTPNNAFTVINFSNAGNAAFKSLSVNAVTVANLPAAPIEGMRASVTDSNAVSFTAGIGSVVVGGGATHVPVYYDGTNWRIG